MDSKTSLYIHIPFCISKCAYCDFFSRPQGNKSSFKGQALVPDSYLDPLCKEIIFRIKYNQIKELKSIYVGGGTPSLLTPAQIKKIFYTINSAVTLSPLCEISLEVNPDDVSEDLLASLADSGVNRISCGIQTMNDIALKKACRRADAAANRAALKLLQDKWKGALSLDLISGLPGDDEEILLSSLQEICQLNPDHISLYSLTIEDETPFGKELNSGALKYDFDKADSLWLRGRDYLEAQGYNWYEVSNFCRPGKECLHNLAYWTHQDYLGCGSGASGSLYMEKGRGIRWTNTVSIEDYIAFWQAFDFEGDWEPSQIEEKLQAVQNKEIIDFETSEFEFFMMSLRKIRGFYLSEYKRIFGKGLPEKFTELFATWLEKGLCEKRLSENGDGDWQYCMSRQGMLFLNRFLEELC